MDKFSVFFLNIFINSFLVFITAAFLIEGLIFLFRIRQGRFASIIRMIPLFKLPFDIFWYDFSKWSYLHGIHPLTCEEGSRNLSITFAFLDPTRWYCLPVSSEIQLTVPNGLTFTVADLISFFINPLILNSFCVLILTCSIGFTLKKLWNYSDFISQLNFLNTQCQIKNRRIRNPSIHQALKKYPSTIAIASSSLDSPFVAGIDTPIIYIPAHLNEQLSRKEYEAILAHEMGHIQYKDNFVRLCLNLIRSFFWWIPTQWMQRRIEEGQEVECDRQCHYYQVNPIDLASAIYKSAKYSAYPSPHHPFAGHLAKRPFQKRLNLLLKPISPCFKKIRLVSYSLAAGTAFFLIFLGRFWIF